MTIMIIVIYQNSLILTKYFTILIKNPSKLQNKIKILYNIPSTINEIHQSIQDLKIYIYIRIHNKSKYIKNTIQFDRRKP